MGFQDMAVENDGASLKITVGTESPEYIQFDNIQGIFGNTIDFTAPTDPLEAETAVRTGENYPYEVMWRCTIQQVDGLNLIFDTQQVTNQAGWTPDAAGLAQCLADINGWIV